MRRGEGTRPHLTRLQSGALGLEATLCLTPLSLAGLPGPRPGPFWAVRRKQCSRAYMQDVVCAVVRTGPGSPSHMLNSGHQLVLL